jgi:hypothetical protein
LRRRAGAVDEGHRGPATHTRGEGQPSWWRRWRRDAAPPLTGATPTGAAIAPGYACPSRVAALAGTARPGARRWRRWLWRRHTASPPTGATPTGTAVMFGNAPPARAALAAAARPGTCLAPVTVLAPVTEERPGAIGLRRLLAEERGQRPTQSKREDAPTGARSGEGADEGVEAIRVHCVVSLVEGAGTRPGARQPPTGGVRIVTAASWTRATSPAQRWPLAWTRADLSVGMGEL